MNSTNKKHSILFRGLILVLAFALSILCFPITGLVAFADADETLGTTNYNFMTIKELEQKNTTVVNKGATYTIRDAYIGNNSKWVVGSDNIVDKVMDNNGATLLSSEVKVTYNGQKVVSSKDTKVDETTSDPVSAYDGTFVADKEGTYVVTYSYTYSLDGKKYTNSYDLQVQSVLPSASISFGNNNQVVMPSVLDLSLKGAKEGDKYKNLNIPLPEVKDENGETIENVKYYTSQPTDKTGNYVVITANGGLATRKVDVTPVEEGEGEEKTVVGAYISGDYFKGGESSDFGDGNYTVKFSYYTDGNFVTSTTKSTMVYAEEEGYYKDYKLQLQLASDWVDNGQTGVERTLPAAIGVTSKDTTPSNESVDVSYKVEVLFTSNKSQSGYRAFTAEEVEQYNKDSKESNEKGKDVFVLGDDNHYYLADPSKFKPLEDGYYTFIYTITDFYGNSVSSARGAYEWQNVKDETKPTPVIYDAAVKDDKGNVTFENADYKLASQTPANGVVVYAITMEDNVKKPGTLSRKVMTSETVSKFTIEGYDSYNLVFNYRQTQDEVGANGEGSAWDNLKTNNFYIRKLAEKHDEALSTEDADKKIDSDAEMLDLLHENNYLIVVDNANADEIYKYFSTKFNAIDGASITDGASLVEWLKGQSEETISGLGFAYIDVDQTFGATSTDKGMGSGYYYIHYIAKDAAGNETDISRRMQIGAAYDIELPTIKFSTTLQTAYAPNSVVKFDAPTATDTQDSYMLVKTMYRYFDSNGNVVEIKNKNNEKISTNNLTELRADLEGKMSGGRYLTDVYAEYLKDAADGYVDLTDRDASSYSIDLSEAGSTATKLQIVVFVYDDMGNANIHAQTVDISNANDTNPPILDEESIQAGETTYEQGATIDLPTMLVKDDAVSYMSFDVDVKYLAEGTSVDITSYGYYGERKVLALNGAGEYYVHAGSFVASWAGEYQVSISVKDGGGHTIVSFINYTVTPRIIVQAPQINTSLPKTQTLELDDYALSDTIEVPAPTVSYDIPRSVTYDQYVADKANYDNSDKTDFVVYGVDKDGKPLNYSTTYGQAGFLRPRELGQGEYDLKYSVNLLAYDYKTFNYEEMKYENGKYEGGYLTYKANSALKTVAEQNHLVVSIGETKFIARLNDKKEVLFRNLDDPEGTEYKIDDPNFTNHDGLENIDETWFSKIKAINLTSETYKLTIQDKKGPKIKDYNDVYETAISKSELEKTKQITIHEIEASDASGIDIEKSYVTLSWRLANGTSSSRELKASDFKDGVYNYQLTNVVDGTYKITYTVYDKAGNRSTSDAYEIAVGDNIAPTMTFADDFVSAKYEIGTELKIDLSSIKLADKGSGIVEGTVPTIVLKNNSTGEEVEAKSSASETLKYYDLSEVGSYTLTFTVEDAVGNKTTKEFTFEVAAKTQDTTNVYKAVGTVLIVVSVLVLAGVIVYFIVSKVKLDKELKK